VVTSTGLQKVRVRCDQCFGLSEVVIACLLVFYEDNLACVAMSENPVRRKYSRHIDIRRYFVRDLVAQQVLKLVPLRTNLIVADVLTKSLPSPAHAKHRVMIGRISFCARILRPATCVVGG
jgi:hypothetical protein